MQKKTIIVITSIIAVLSSYGFGYLLGKFAGWSDGFRTATDSSACKISKRDYRKITK